MPPPPRGEPPLLVVCDEISDPHNLGVSSTPPSAPGHGLIIPKRRSAGLTAIVGKTSAGGRQLSAGGWVANLTSVLKDLKKTGGLDLRHRRRASTNLYSADLKGRRPLSSAPKGTA